MSEFAVWFPLVLGIVFLIVAARWFWQAYRGPRGG